MAALNTWTIPSDPGFQTKRPKSIVVKEIDCKRPKARVKPEAMMIAIKNQGTVAQLFNPNSKPATFRNNRLTAVNDTKRDFIKENTKQIRTIEKSHRESEATSKQLLKGLCKCDKYEYVESKLAQDVKATPQSSAMPRSGRPTSKSAHHAHLCSGSPVSHRPVAVRSVEPQEDKAQNSISHPTKEEKKAGKVNYISKNIRHVSSSPVPRRRAPSAVASEELERKRFENEKKYKRGEVPSYLRKRQEEWKTQEEERVRNMPDPSIPPGHALMPRDERLQTLELLAKKQKEMTRELNSLPVSCDTLRIKTRKVELENKLQEIENALKIFSRPKVFVKIDS